MDEQVEPIQDEILDPDHPYRPTRNPDVGEVGERTLLDRMTGKFDLQTESVMDPMAVHFPKPQRLEQRSGLCWPEVEHIDVGRRVTTGAVEFEGESADDDRLDVIWPGRQALAQERHHIESTFGLVSDASDPSDLGFRNARGHRSRCRSGRTAFG